MAAGEILASSKYYFSLTGLEDLVVKKSVVLAPLSKQLEIASPME